MEEKVRFCRPEEEFNIEELFSALGPLEPEEAEFFSLVREYMREEEKENPGYFLMWFRIALVRRVSSLQKKSLDFFGMYDYYGCGNSRFYEACQSDAAVSLFQKIYIILDNAGFIRKDFKIDDRIDSLYETLRGAEGNDLRTEFFTEFKEFKLYEVYEINADSRISMVMEFLKDKLPPLQYDLFKYHIEYGNYQDRYYFSFYEDRPSQVKDDCLYTEFESRILSKAIKNAGYYYNDIINIILF